MTLKFYLPLTSVNNLIAEAPYYILCFSVGVGAPGQLCPLHLHVSIVVVFWNMMQCILVAMCGCFTGVSFLQNHLSLKFCYTFSRRWWLIFMPLAVGSSWEWAEVLCFLCAVVTRAIQLPVSTQNAVYLNVLMLIKRCFRLPHPVWGIILMLLCEIFFRGINFEQIQNWATWPLCKIYIKLDLLYHESEKYVSGVYLVPKVHKFSNNLGPTPKL
jgi:hypothetical protein